MNKILALFFGIGAISGISLSQKESFQALPFTRFGNATGEIRTFHVTHGESMAYGTFGLFCMVACFYFMAQARRDDLRK